MNKQYVALVKRACPICSAPEDAEILLATQYDRSGEPVKDLAEYDGKVVGISDNACKSCKKRLNMEEFFVLIEFDEAKTDDKSNPWKTGVTVQVKKESNFGKHIEQFTKNGLAYVGTETAKEIKNMVVK